MAALSDLRDQEPVRASRLIAAGAIATVLGALGWAIGLIADSQHALFAFLAAWIYAVVVAVGALIFLAASHAIGARWVAVVRRLCHGIVSVFPLLALGLIPLLLGAGELYPWLDPPASMTEHELHLIHHKQAYLNLGDFGLRSALYFAVWILAAELLRRGSLRRDRMARSGRSRAEDSPNQRERNLSAAALPFIFLAITFAAFDWVMSLQPLWMSTIFGLYLAANGFVAALALLTLLSWASSRQNRPLAGALSPDHFHALGRLLLAFTVFWAYCAYFQAMLIRAANLPQEVTFYLTRIEGGWKWASWLLIVGHFAVPFGVLLLRSWKRVGSIMAAVAAWILVMAFVDVYWLVMPALEGHPAVPDWIDLSALVLVVGASLLVGGWRQRGHALIAHGDPKLEAGLAYRSKS